MKHIANETDASANLPPNPIGQRHWTEHSKSHDSFVAGYNDIVINLSRNDIAASIRKAERLMTRWASEHLRRFSTDFAVLTTPR